MKDKNQAGAWIPVFKTGRWTDSGGRSRSWTAGDLDGIAQSYDSKRHEAPVVIGHPEDNSPAWGWVESLKREGDILYAKLRDLVPEFVDMLGRRLFKKRSISLYPDMTLRHIGFLGAAPPAVKGLPDISFCDEGASLIEFDESRMSDERGLLRRLKELLREALYEGEDDSGKMREDAGVPAGLVDKDEASAFSEKEAALKAAIEAKEAELRKARQERDKAEISSFCERLLKEGRLTPAMMKMGMGIGGFMEAVSSIETAWDFKEAEGKETPLGFFKSFLSSLPIAVEFCEKAGGGFQGEAGGVERLVSSYMEENRLSYRDAVIALSKEHPELFKR
jgi:hypothetical protein